MDLPIKLLFFYGSAVLASLLLAFCIILIATTNEYPVIIRSKKEKEFIDPVTGKVILFPSINDDPTVQLSVIVPAYNEEDRLSPMLEECVEFLEARKDGFTYEIIVVSDGSTDGTLKVANKWCTKLGTNKMRVLGLETNRGKGGAVRLGMQSARGAVLLFADADGATKFADLTKLEKSLNDLTGVDYQRKSEEASRQLAIIVGSRAHLEKEAVAKRSFFRTVLMYGFHFLVWLFTVRGIKDTQCGFKLFTRKAARICFDNIHVERWAFDVELLYIAQALHIPIAEIAVNWTEIEGSKLTPFWSSIQMGKDLGLIWLRYLIGAWKIKDQKSKKDRPDLSHDAIILRLMDIFNVGALNLIKGIIIARRSLIYRAFDVELLYISQALHIPIAEIAVNWTEIEGSKLTPFWSSIQMGKDLRLIWLRYLIGAWKIKDQKSKRE